MQVYLETDRLILRTFTPDDADNLGALDADPEVMRHLSGGVPTPREEIEGNILPHFIAQGQRADGYGFWAAIERATGDFLGWFHLRPLPDAPPGEVELGYRLRRAAWGKGYGTEAARALVRKGFVELGAARIVASTAAANIGSRRVMEKSGLSFVRAYRAVFPGYFNDEEQEDVEYALTRGEWERGGAGD